MLAAAAALQATAPDIAAAFARLRLGGGARLYGARTGIADDLLARAAPE
jgi:hypothetical protein